MTGAQIKAKAEAHCEEGESIDTIKAKEWINECIVMAIGKDAMYLKTTLPIFITNKDEWHDLPVDLLEVMFIEKTGAKTPYFGNKNGFAYRGHFEIMGGSIQISDTGTFTIKYLAIPPEINSINDTPAIHKLFHYPISFYVAARHKFYQDQENPDTDRLMMEFGAYLAKAVSDLKKILMPTVKPARQVRIRPWT